MKIVAMALMVSVIFVSCSQIQTLSRYKRNFTYCNEGRYTGLDTLININGVYSISKIRDMYNKPFPVHKIDTFYLNIMFWDDGTSVYNCLGKPTTIQSEFDSILFKLEKGKKEYFFKASSWGNYRIIGD